MAKVTIVKNTRNAETLRVSDLSEVIRFIQECKYAKAIDMVRGISLHTDFTRQDDGSVVWYASAEELPASLGIEHQKYIREVFPRLIAEAEAGNWKTVDAYIDRMMEYQCQFGGSKLSSSTSSNTVIIAVLILLLCGVVMAIRSG